MSEFATVTEGLMGEKFKNLNSSFKLNFAKKMSTARIGVTHLSTNNARC